MGVGVKIYPQFTVTLKENGVLRIDGNHDDIFIINVSHVDAAMAIDLNPKDLRMDFVRALDPDQRKRLMEALNSGRFVIVPVTITPEGSLEIGQIRPFGPDTGTVDNAAITKPDYGGIDFNAANLNLQIKRDGKGVALPINQQNLENIRIDGLVPVIIDIKPVMASSPAAV